ncbi:MAG: sulfatase [Phycisphaerae bacterium]
MSRKPNILLITADQLRADVLGCHGNPVCRTPNLDALADSGTLFENAYTPNPICVPARATITTGNYSHRATGTKNNSGRIRDDQPILARHFAAHGYRTYACGKLHYVPYQAPDKPRLTHGFEVWDSAESGRMIKQFDPKGRRGGVEDYHDFLCENGWGGYERAHGIGNNDVRPCASPLPEELNVDHWVADRTIQRLGEHERDHSDQPFLMWCSFPKPHSPYDPPMGYADMYDPRQVPECAGDESMLDDRNPNIIRTRTTHAHDSLSPEARRVIKAYYYALTTFHDAQIGRVLSKLEELGLAEDTIVIYTADHGDLMGDFGSWFKQYFLEGSAHIPLIVRTPDGPEGQRRTQLAGLQDILPTLADLTGCPLDQEVHGTSLRPCICDDWPTRELFYGQCNDAPRQAAMVTDGTIKYCWAQENGTEELYNLAEDPQELVNLASRAENETLLAEWRGKLIEQAKRFEDNGLFDDDGQLVRTKVDLDELRKLPVGGMGWRWY